MVVFRPIQPYTFGYAAGAMIFLVFSETISESRDSQSQRISTAIGGMVEFLVIMVIQNVFVA